MHGTAFPDGGFGIHNEPGWYGAFTRDQATGALANGSAVVKRNSEPKDTHADGTRGTVLGSFRATPTDPVCYFIEWEPRPKTAVAVLDFKLAACN